MMTRTEIMTVALTHDPQAEWASDEPDENCLLISHSAAVFLLDREPGAWEDPNPPGVSGDHTRIVFPGLR